MIVSDKESRRWPSRLLAAGFLFLLPVLSHAQALQPPVLLGPAGPSGWGPLSFNDPIFTGMTEVRNLNSVQFGNVTRMSVTGRHTTQVTSAYDCSQVPGTMSFTRLDVTDTAINMFNDMTITDSYIHNCGLGSQGDHSDGVLTFTSDTFNDTYRRVMFDSTATGSCDIVGTAIRHGDQGRIGLMLLDHVYVRGGLGIQVHTPDTGPWTMHVDLQNVCIEKSAINIDNWAVSGTNNVIVDHWINVNNCTISGGTVVVGSAISCSSAVHDISAGTVTGCPN